MGDELELCFQGSRGGEKAGDASSSGLNEGRLDTRRALSSGAVQPVHPDGKTGVSSRVRLT